MDNMNNNANFINATVETQTVPCPNCKTLNKADSKFCIFCGSEIVAKAPAQPQAPKNPFGTVSDAPAEKTPAPTNPFGTVSNIPVEKTPASGNPFGATPAITKSEPEEPKPAFANGLPSWDIVPPNIPVRRIRH